MTPNRQLTPSLIRAHLTDAGWRPTEIARQLNVSNASVSMVINGKSKSARIADFIAQKLGQTKEKIWPDIY